MTIVLVEYHWLLREAIRRSCVEESGHEGVGETNRGSTAIESVHRVKPDLVILALDLSGLDGFVVAETIQHALPGTRFLIITASLEDYTIFRVGKWGIQGFLDKGTNIVAPLQAALEALAAGKSYFSPAFHAARLSLRTNAHSFEKILSESEQEILTWSASKPTKSACRLGLINARGI